MPEELPSFLFVGLVGVLFAGAGMLLFVVTYLMFDYTLFDNEL